MAEIEFHGLIYETAEYGAIPKVWYRYEPEEIAMAQSLFDADDIVMVAGCGMGLLAAEVMATGASVVAVEPQEHLVDIARANVAVDGLPLDVYHGALVADDDDRLTVHYVQHDNWAMTQVGAEVGSGTIVESCPAVRLGESRRAINALALDVEGAEDVLVEWIPDGVKKLLIEVHYFVLGPDSDVVQRLMDRGWQAQAEAWRNGREVRVLAMVR